MKTRGFLGFVGASFLLIAVGSVLTMSAYAGTGSAPPPPPPPPPTTTSPPPQSTTPPPVTTTPTTTTTPTQTSSGSSSSGTKVRVHHKVKQHAQQTRKKKLPANTTPQTTPKPAPTLAKPKAIVPVSSPSHNGVLQFAAVAALVAAALVVMALLALVISVAVVRMRSPHGAHGGNIKMR